MILAMTTDGADVDGDAIQPRDVVQKTMKPISPATMTTPRWLTGCGCMRRSTDARPATTDESAIIATMNTPARSSARP